MRKPQTLRRIQAVLDAHEATSFQDLVQEYADMGYSEYAVAQSLLEIDTGSMRSWLDTPVVFKKQGDHGVQRMHDFHDAAQRGVATRKGNGFVRWIEVDGVRRTITEWSAITGVNVTTIGSRLDRGTPPKVAVFTRYLPRGAHNPHRRKPRASEQLDFKNPETRRIEHEARQDAIQRQQR